MECLLNNKNHGKKKIMCARGKATGYGWGGTERFSGILQSFQESFSGFLWNSYIMEEPQPCRVTGAPAVLVPLTSLQLGSSVQFPNRPQ